MDFEETMDAAMLYSISPELTCQCDEVHICQQCQEDWDDDEKYSVTVTSKRASLF